MKNNNIEISVCICTYKRPEMLSKLLVALNTLETNDMFTFSAVIVDNDHNGSAMKTVDDVAAKSNFVLEYYIQPERNIALTRNMAIRKAAGDLVAFIDDDEVPTSGWLINLYRTYRKFKVDGVLGPVRPHFETPPPKWVLRGRFCERPEHLTGEKLHWSKTRTGNVLLARQILEGDYPFDPDFAVGGEDVNFFKERIDAGCTFVWCNEAVVYENVPPSRCRAGYFVRRMFLKGNVSARYCKTLDRFTDRVKACMNSVTVLIIYTAMLPFTIVAGIHVFMKYLTKDFYHLGRLLGILRLATVEKRNI